MSNLDTSLFATYRELRPLVPKDDKWRTSALLVSTIFCSGLEILGLAVIIPLLALISPSTEQTGSLAPQVFAFLPAGDATSQASWVILICALVFLFKNLLLAAHAWFEAAFAFSLHARLSGILVRKILGQGYSHITKSSPSQLTSLLTTDIASVVFHSLLPALTIVSEIIFLAAIVVFLSLIEPTVTAIVSATTGFIGIVLVYRSRRLTSDLGAKRQQLEAKKTGELQQVFSGIRDVILYDASRELSARLDHSLHDLSNVYRNFQLLSTAPRFFLEFVVAITLLIIVWASLSLGISSHEILTKLGIFTASGFRLLIGANRLVMSAQNLRFGRSALSRVFMEVTTHTIAPAALPERTAESLPGALTGVSLDHVSYRYPGTGKLILDNVSTNFPAGSIVGITGKSGEGKSTLLDIVAGLLHPTAGRVLANERDIFDLGDTWRHSIGYVGQAPIVFADTLRRNIAFGIPDDLIDDRRVREAVTAAQLDEFVGRAPDGLDTLLREGGQQLSGGQKQRIAIARALYRRSTILLLDEPTAALDPQTEDDFMQTLFALCHNRVIVMVSHRPSTLGWCNVLYRVEDGRVEPCPPHAVINDPLRSGV